MSRISAKAGFTLIELLVVIAIIGLLASIAIPQFAAYRRRGFTSQVQTDIRNAATAQEGYFTEHKAYKTCDPCNATNLPGFVATQTVRIKAELLPAESFKLTGTHVACGADAWTFDSNSPKIVDDGTPCY